MIFTMNNIPAVLILLVSSMSQVLAAPPRDAAMPPLQLDFTHIKTPQLIGIIAGTCVFVITISVVVYLLYASGTLGRAMSELVSDAKQGGVTISLSGKDQKKKAITSPFVTQAELYDHLIEARNKLPKKLDIPDLVAKHVVIRKYCKEKDAKLLFEASNGTAQYHESAYDLARIWGWEDVNINKDTSTNSNSVSARRPWESQEAFERFLAEKEENLDALHLVIEEKEYKKPIGMITLCKNDVANLSVVIENTWITPAFQTMKRPHEAYVFVLNYLFQNGYRRVTAEVDERNIIARKFLQRCGFQLEAVLRKSKIVQNKNSNSALYSMLNSEWPDHEPKLRILADCKEEKKLKIAEVFTFDSSPPPQQVVAANNGKISSNTDNQSPNSSASKDKKPKKKKKN